MLYTFMSDGILRIWDEDYGMKIIGYGKVGRRRDVCIGNNGDGMVDVYIMMYMYRDRHYDLNHGH